MRNMIAVLGLLALLPVQAEDDIQQLRKEVQEIKQGQAAIQKDLQDIKKLLQQKEARSPISDVNLMLTVREDDPVKGDKTAKLTLFEYADYQCPFCVRHETQTMPLLETNYVATGKLRLVFRDLPLQMHANAQKAAEACRCAGEQGAYWEMHSRLLAQQNTAALQDLPGQAKELGMDADQFKQCLDSGRYADGIAQDKAEASKAGITSTPSFMLGITQPGGQKVKVVKLIRGAVPFDKFKEQIDTLLAAQK